MYQPLQAIDAKMSQQKVALALFAVAGLAACAAGQSLNPLACSRNIQKEVSK